MLTRWIDDATVLEGAHQERIDAPTYLRVGRRRLSHLIRIATAGLTVLLLGIALLPALALLGLFVIPLSPVAVLVMMMGASEARAGMSRTPRTPRSSEPRPRGEVRNWGSVAPRAPAFA